MTGELYIGDVRDGLRKFIADGVRARTCVTSPPYWGLRDYGVAGQLGLEPTPAAFLDAMVEVFRLVRDALADDGTLWLNMGDAYAGGGKAGNPPDSPHQKQATNRGSLLHAGYHEGARQAGVVDRSWQKPPPGYKAKDLMGMPWRLAFALQADGWWLRQDIIWSKPNPMPESIRDRCTKAHEYLFLLSKRERYYFDGRAIAEPRASQGGSFVNGWATGDTPHDAVAHSRDKGNARTFRGGGKYTGGREKTSATVNRESHGNAAAERETRNRRSVWTIPSEPFKEAHFATFPRALVEPCVLAGSAPGDVVLDPFMGSGTVAEVAQRMGRRWIGCELNPQYAAMVDRRSAQRGIEFPATASATE